MPLWMAFGALVFGTLAVLHYAERNYAAAIAATGFLAVYESLWFLFTFREVWI